MKKTLTATAMLVGLGASSAGAQTLALQGSDTLFEMMNDPVFGLLQLCPAADAFLDYAGGGSSNGENAADGNLQEIAPMSRFLDAQSCNLDPSAFSGCFRHSLDGLSNVAVDTAAEDCDTLRWSGSMSLPGGGTYTFQDWRSVLRIIYGGQSDQITAHDPCAVEPAPRSAFATKDCASEVRTTLVNTWGNMFAKADGTACTNGNCTALKHAFRRDDVSGTTDTFLELLALPKISASSPPFCNGTETQDNDPIRRQCTGNGYTNGEQVCKGANPASPTTTGQGLGLVLPVLIPQQNPYPANPQNFCAPTSFGGAAFGDVAMPFPPPASCPNGAALIGGTCKWPRKAGTASGNFDCLAGQADRPAGTPSTFDGRFYNTFLRNAAGTILNYQRRSSTGVISNLPMTSAYYRIHQSRAISGSTLPANTGCALNNETQQIGCMVEASPCSIGYSGLTAVLDSTTGLPDPNRKGLGLRSAVPGANAAVFPTKADVRLLLQPSGASCTPDAVLDGGYEDRYPLARGLYVCTVNGIPGVAGATAWTATGTQTTQQLDAQASLISCLTNRSVVDQSVNGANFVTLDDTGTAPVSFLTCADMGL